MVTLLIHKQFAILPLNLRWSPKILKLARPSASTQHAQPLISMSKQESMKSNWCKCMTLQRNLTGKWHHPINFFMHNVSYIQAPFQHLNAFQDAPVGAS